MTEWSVHVSARGQGITDEEALDLATALHKHNGVVGHATDRLSATFTVRAATVREAFDRAHSIFEATTKANVAATLLVDEINAVEHERLREHLANPTMPPLVGVSEVAGILGVTKQRVMDLVNNSKSFPRPVAELAGGRVWTRTAIEAFSAQRPGKPGRPKIVSEPAATPHVTHAGVAKKRRAKQGIKKKRARVG